MDFEAQKDAMGAALQRLEAALVQQPRTLQRVLRRGLRKGVTHQQLWWAKQQLGCSIPAPLRELYTWHDGQRAAEGLFDCAFVHCADGAGAEVVRGCWLSLATVVRYGAHPAEYYDEELYATRFGTPAHALELVPAGNGAKPTTLIPFGAFHLDADQASSAGDAPPDPDDFGLQLGLDTTSGRVYLFEAAHEGFEPIVEVAPSLPAFFEAAAAALEGGTMKLPAVDLAGRGPKQAVDAARLFVEELVQRRLVELAPDVELEPLVRKAGTLLRRKPKNRAVQDVVAWIETDERFDESFAEPEVLAVFVAEYVG